MNTYSISNNFDKEVTVANENGVKILFNTIDSTHCIFKGTLDEMLRISQGRPWTLLNRNIEVKNISKEKDTIYINVAADTNVECSLSLYFDSDKLLRLRIVWMNRGKSELNDTVLGFSMKIPEHEKEKITMPHMIYNNNPSADPNRLVPHIDKGEGKGFVCEEHRLPTPAVNVEWKENNNFEFITLFSIPSKVDPNNEDDHLWSLGGVREADGLDVVLLSGALMFNGEKDIVYGFKNTPVPYKEGYLDFKPDSEVAKELVLDWGFLAQEGRGFRNIIHNSYKIYKPQNEPKLSYEEIIKIKINAADTRWYDEDNTAGYIKFLKGNLVGKELKKPRYFLYGWTGQSMKISWCNAKYGFWDCDEKRLDQCERAVNFYLDNSNAGVKGLRYSSYMIDSKSWGSSGSREKPTVTSRMLGENLTDMGDIILLYRENNRPVPQNWIDGITETADFLISDSVLLDSGIYPATWATSGEPDDKMISAAGIPCVQALARVYECTGNRSYLEKAEEILAKYYEIHAATFEVPFARSTLDARCEDKEAGLYFFLSAYDLFRLTRKDEYKEWAALGADWILTYVYFWNPWLRKGLPCEAKGFTVTGWPGVSVQNHHLDVFFPAYELWDFGKISGNGFYEHMGKLVYNAFTNGICTEEGEWNFAVKGEQGEQYYQTNWSPDFNKWRGGFNVWNPSWVLAQVLKAALRFSEVKE